MVAILRSLLAATLLAATVAAQAALPIQHWSRPDGAQVFFVESRAVPIVDAQIDFDAGARREPPALVGLAGATARMIDKGVKAHGSEPALNENALDDAWSDLGASFGAGAGDDRFSFWLRSLSEPALLDRAGDLAARQIGEPSFPAPVWQAERQRVVAALREAETRPGLPASRAFQRAVFGTHPYARQTEESTLNAVTVAAMRDFHARMNRCGAKVSIVGALDRAQADELAGRLLARLGTTACTPQPALAAVAALTAPRDIRLPFASAQAHVLIGQPGIARDDPDYFALTVGNYILGGGGFASRLTQQVREDRGLTYGVFSSFDPQMSAGAFTVSLQTRPDQAVQAVGVVRDVLSRFIADGPTEAELKAAQDNLIGGFPLRLDSNAKLIGNVSNIAWYGLPLDYLDTWVERVRAVSAADIRKAFARVLQPDRMVTVVVGGAT